MSRDINKSLSFLCSFLEKRGRWSWLHPPVLNQNRSNGCTAYATTSMIEYYQRKNLLNISLSAQALYYWTRELNDQQNLNVGVYPDDTFKLALETGIPKQIYHDNAMQNQFTKPSIQASRDAFINKIDSWEELFNFRYVNADKSDIIAEQLANGDVVGISIFVNSDLYYDNSRNGIVDIGSRDIGASHQLMVIDYKPDPNNKGKRLFLCQNSWGTSYGIKPEGGKGRGFIWLTEAYVERYCHYAGVIEWGYLHSRINSIERGNQIACFRNTRFIA